MDESKPKKARRQNPRTSRLLDENNARLLQAAASTPNAMISFQPFAANAPMANTAYPHLSMMGTLPTFPQFPAAGFMGMMQPPPATMQPPPPGLYYAYPSQQLGYQSLPQSVVVNNYFTNTDNSTRNVTTTTTTTTTTNSNNTTTTTNSNKTTTTANSSKDTTAAEVLKGNPKDDESRGKSEGEVDNVSGGEVVVAASNNAVSETDAIADGGVAGDVGESRGEDDAVADESKGVDDAAEEDVEDNVNHNEVDLTHDDDDDTRVHSGHNKWACVSCTFLNPDDIEECQMCGEPFDGDRCPICKEFLFECDEVKVLRECRHRFHVLCFDKFVCSGEIVDNEFQVLCPFCKKRVIFD